MRKRSMISRRPATNQTDLNWPHLTAELSKLNELVIVMGFARCCAPLRENTNHIFGMSFSRRGWERSDVMAAIWKEMAAI